MPAEKLLLKWLISLVLLVPNTLFAEIIVPPEVYHLQRNQTFIRKDLTIQVIQDQFTFNKSNIKRASLIKQPNGGFSGLEIELKPEAAKALEHLTKTNLGKSINLLLNKKIISTPVIQTPLREKFIIASITKEDAEAFVGSLNEVNT